MSMDLDAEDLKGLERNGKELGALQWRVFEAREFYPGASIKLHCGQDL